jgi:glycosyltransferase involved in cell wall biosynthesis
LYRSVVDYGAATSVEELARLSQWLPEAEPMLVSGLPNSLDYGGDPAPDPDGRFRILFLGRVHPTKGLLELLHALRSMPQPCLLTIRGPIDNATYWEECQAAAAALPVQHRVSYFGPASQEEVAHSLRTNDIMVSLTLGENFGHAIAEALQLGCPVLTTAATPWTDVLRGGGGYVVTDRNSTVDVVAALSAAYAHQGLAAPLQRQKARRAFDEFMKQQPEDVITQVTSRIRPG